MLIYCVEDNEDIRNTILYALKMGEFDAKGFGESISFFDALNSEIPDLILLDLMLPGKDGMSILKDLRKDSRTESVPVIITTAQNTEFDKVLGLDTGADDYLVKPFGMLELMSRIKAVLRRSKPKEIKVIENGDIKMSVENHQVSVAGDLVELTLKEFHLLKIFLEHPGKVYTRDQLTALVWGDSFVGESRTVDVHIGTLRTKLKGAGDNIKTVRGVGYKMTPIV